MRDQAQRASNGYMSGGPGQCGPVQRGEVHAFVVATLLFAAVLAFVSSCGSEDLTFPGNVVQTETPQFTNTPGPTSTATTAP